MRESGIAAAQIHVVRACRVRGGWGDIPENVLAKHLGAGSVCCYNTTSPRAIPLCFKGSWLALIKASTTGEAASPPYERVVSLLRRM